MEAALEFGCTEIAARSRALKRTVDVGHQPQRRPAGQAKKEIFQEAESNGFDVKVLREIVRLRKQDQRSARSASPCSRFM